MFQTTTNKGLTWTRHVMKGIKGGPRPYVAADPSHRGRFAVLLSTGSGNLEIWITNNSGVSFKKTTTLVPAEGDSLIKPWIAYSRSGALGVVWRTQHSSGKTDVFAVVSPAGGTSFSDVVTYASKIPPDPVFGPGDDCACNLHLDATTVSTTWAADTRATRQVYYGRFDYTNLNSARHSRIDASRGGRTGPGGRASPGGRLAATGSAVGLGLVGLAALVGAAWVRQVRQRVVV